MVAQRSSKKNPVNKTAAASASKRVSATLVRTGTKHTALPPRKTSAAKGKRIFITGVSGHFAGRLLSLLEKDPAIGKIVGIDLVPPSTPIKKLEFHALDVRDPAVSGLMKGCDAVVHLAFILLRLPGQRDEDSINIGGSRAIFEAAIANHVRKIIFTSSVVAYGLHADNPVPLTEKCPLRPNAEISYSRAKGEVEQLLDRIEREHPKVVITRLRPSTIAGPAAPTSRMASLTGSQGVLISGHNPAIQLTHEDDLAAALYLALKKDLRGAYNTVSDQPATLPALYAMRSAKVMTVSPTIGRFLMWLMWITGKTVFAPEWIKLSMFSIVADNRKLKQQGWKPKYSTMDTFLSVLRAHGIDVEP